MGKQTGAIRFTGKLANVVGFRTASGEGIRERITEVRNPKSAGQNVQRMILATTAISMSYLTKVLNNAVKGKSYGNPSLNYLRKIWMNELRADIANQGGANTRYNVKGDQNFSLNPYLLSKGGLQPINLGLFPTGQSVKIESPVLRSQLTTASFNQIFPSVKLGHQLTFIGVFRNTTTNELLVGYARVAAKTNENPFLIPSGEENVYKINPAAVNTALAEGDWQNITFENDGETDKLFFTPVATGAGATTPLVACAIIVSDKRSGNRSTTRLNVATNAHVYYPANWEEAAASYGAVESSIDLPADAYLDNSADVPEEAPISNLEIVKIYDVEDPIVEEPVEKQFLIAGKSYFIKMNKSIAGSTASASINTVTVNSVTDDKVKISLGASAEGSFSMTIAGNVFAGFVANQ